MAIQGLLAERDDEMRIYVVTINTPPEYAWIHAVSYTHLRAHETVLDIVCRLLLEKKQR